ncbi:MAG: ATP-binding cassette domain-containing protein [Candidatus Desulfofervidus auxilii]|nr:ATP-binding cassette domain-containing protein [Candidatus Desulfofervidus auxilii]
MLSVNFKKTLPNFCLDIAFEIPKHSYSFILGSSGAGKSLTLKIIAGLDDKLPFC